MVERQRHWAQRYLDDPRCGVPGCPVTDPDVLFLTLNGLRCAEHRPTSDRSMYGTYVPNRFTPRGSKKGSRNKKDIHAHGCTRCKHYFEDACYEPEKNHVCSFCESGTGWMLLRKTHDPAECCKQHSRLARKEEVASYGLAGDKPWWICSVCKRRQIYKPQ